MAAIFLQGQYQLFRQLDRLSQAAREVVAQAVAESADRIHAQAGQLAPQDTGLLKGALKVVILGRGLTARIYALPDYALPVEMGYLGQSGRGNRGHKMPMVKIGGKWQLVPSLADWASRNRVIGAGFGSHWGTVTAFPLARKILMKGYKAHPFLFDAMEREKAHFLAAVKRAIELDLARRAPPPAEAA